MKKVTIWPMTALMLLVTTNGYASNNDIEPFGWYPPVVEDDSSATYFNDKNGRIAGCESVTNGVLDKRSDLCKRLKGQLAPTDITPAYVAVPLADQGNWIQASDFPRTRETANHHGMAVMKYMIAESGIVDDCAIVQIKGNASFGDAACRALMSRARFRPAHDNQSQPLRAARIQRVAW